MKIVIFTDLDATLLDAETYSWEPARHALEELNKRQSSIVLVSSKTFSEILPLHRQLGLTDPFVVENGGGIVMDSRSWAVEYFRRRGHPLEVVDCGDFALLPLGVQYDTLIRELHEMGSEVGCSVRGFFSMSAAEVAELTALSIEDARKAKRRQFDEPFLVTDARGECEALLSEAAGRRGLIVATGGRFLHLIGHKGKGRAVALLIAAYRELYGEIVTLGLGDSPNDFPFLEVVDIPILVGVTSDIRQAPQYLSHARFYRMGGPYGWNSAVLEALADIAGK
ncbi:MAG: HAD-IIB family hydrolase [Desulfomonile sp.]|nr:HAD-IIB family hydrolase [Desulfomonile sp.]